MGVESVLDGDGPEPTLAAGTVVGGRFAVETLSTSLGSIEVYGARDQKTQRLVALWLIPAGALPDAHVEATRRSVRYAATIQHRDLIAPFGTAVLPDGALCVASEPLGDSSLADIVAARRAEGRAHTPLEAFSFVTNVLSALTAAAGTVVHGAIAPDLVRLDGGRVRLAGLGLLTPLVLLDAVPTRYVAPEVRRGQEPTEMSDVFSVGALLFEVLTGKNVDPRVSPSSLAPGIPAALDVVIETCLSADPDDRFESVAALHSALAAIVAPGSGAVVPRAATPDEIPVEFDTAAPGEIPVEFDVALPSKPAPPTGDAELSSLLKAVTTDDSDRWMFSHGGLDHGPLTARDLVAAIVRHEVLPDDDVVNMETGERRKLLDWPQYREFVETAVATRKGPARKAATHEAIAEHHAARKGKMLIAGAAAISLTILGAVFWVTVGPGAKKTRTAAEIDQLISRGELHVQTSSVVLLPPPPPSARRPSGGGGGGGGHGGGMSYEAAMAQPIDFNFTGAGPGGGTLRDAEITRPLNASLSQFASCLDGSARNVRLRIAIGGNGRAMGVTVENGSAGLKGCVARTVRGLSWRAFGGPRIGLSWGFGI
ncbi:MAG: protein kinase [Polyangiales bacterium]